MRAARARRVTLALALVLQTAPDCRVSARGVAFSTAAEMRTTMEQEIGKVAIKLQSMYEDIVAKENYGACAMTEMCDANANVWKDATAQNQHMNPTTSTCVRRDRDSSGSYLIQTANGAVTGRNILPCVTTAQHRRDGTTCQKENCAWKQVEYELNNGVKTHTINPVGQQDQLVNQSCMSSGDLQKCTVDSEKYGVSWPDGWSYKTGDPLVRAEICATNQLVPLFKDTKARYSETHWQFMGMQKTGIYRNWPAIYQCRTENICSGCSDPRFRGWYASAASGAKDLVLVVDTSASMATAARMGHVKIASKWVLNTLTEVDRASVVRYSGNAESYAPKLKKVTAFERAKMATYIQKFEPFGKTNMYAGFKLAFDIFGASTSTGPSDTLLTTRCSKVILFLTDGENTGDDPISMINQENSGPYGKTHILNPEHVRIFTYSFGDLPDPDQPNLMKQVACQNGGVYKHIPDSQAKHLKEAMASYYVYLAAGINKPQKGQNAPVSWAEPFEDGQGTGPLTAACARVYDYTSDPWALFGVICLGVSMQHARQHADWTSTWASMEGARAQCPSMSLTWAQLESLRKEAGGALSSCDAPPATHDPAAADSAPVLIIILCAVAGVCVLLMLWKVCSGDSRTKPTGGRMTAPETTPSMAYPMAQVASAPPGQNPHFHDGPVVEAVAVPQGRHY